MSRLLILTILFFSISAYGQEPSVCYGTTSNGRLENGWELPSSGANYSTHWLSGRLAGRSFVHSSVYPVVIKAYAALNESMPDRVFVYGDIGWRSGGQFKPHKTHRNGLSVDFMVPVLNSDGESVPIPSSIFNRWGYDLEFDSRGRLDDFRIDFDAIAEHVYQLHVLAKEDGIDIWRVIVDPKLQPLLHDSPRWAYLKENVQFSKRQSWVRHDEHYHVDFEVPCKPL